MYYYKRKVAPIHELQYECLIHDILLFTNYFLRILAYEQKNLFSKINY